MADGGSESFPRFLERSLRLLEREAPGHLAAARARMRGIAVCIQVGGSEAIRVQLDAAPWVGPPAAAEVVAEISPDDLAAILGGEVTIEEALDREHLELCGALDDLLRFLDALAAWVHGAVRCPSMALLYQEYLTRVRRAPASSGSERSELEH